MRRQNYSFVAITPPISTHHTTMTPAMHFTRIVVAVVTAIALDLATFATISTLISGR